MADFGINVQATGLQRVAAQLGGMGEYLDKFTRSLLISEAANAARAFIKFSPPIPKGGGWGDTPAAKKQGELAVEKDVRSFVMPKHGSLATAVMGDDMESFIKWKNAPASGWAKRSSTSIAAKIKADTNLRRAFSKAKGLVTRYAARMEPRKITASGQLGAAHSELKTRYRGRIRHNGGPGMDVKMRPFIASEARIANYIKLVQQNVGTLSHYWWTIIEKMPPVLIKGVERRAGMTGVPVWIKRRPFVHRADGVIIDNIGTRATTMSSITIKNPIGDIFGVAREAKTKANVIRYRQVANSKKPWDKILNQALLVSNRGGKPQ